MCSVLNVTKQNTEEKFADEMGSKGLIRLMVVPNQVAGLNYTTTPALELADVPDAPLCKPTQVDPFVECVTNALRWTRANSTTIRGFSGAGWFTGAAVLKAAIASKSADASVPLGLLRSSWGGTRVEEWSGPSAIAACPPQTGAGSGVSTLWANMIMPFRGLSFRAYTYYQGESNVGADAPCTGAKYYSCALPAMLRDLRQALDLPKLPIMVELAAYCNERDFATYHTWCDETKSILNGTDYHLPALRLAQASAARLSDVYMIANLDLGSLHAPHGSIHSVPKDKLGARLALAIQASASTTSAVVWAGPTATGVSHGSQPWESAAGGKLVVHFNVSEGAGGLVLSNSESCPPTMLEIYCTEAGFEVRADGVWSPVKSATAGADHKSIVLEVTAKADRVRYAYSDWPLAMVRNRVGGLPARLFDMTVSAPASLNHSVVMLRVEEIHATTLKTDDDTAAAAAVTYHYPSDCCCENVYPRSAKNVVQLYNSIRYAQTVRSELYNCTDRSRVRCELCRRSTVSRCSVSDLRRQGSVRAIGSASYWHGLLHPQEAL